MITEATSSTEWVTQDSGVAVQAVASELEQLSPCRVLLNQSYADSG